MAQGTAPKRGRPASDAPQRLVAAAADLLTRKQPSGITGPMLADLAGVTYSQISHHFRTKDALLVAGLAQNFHRAPAGQTSEWALSAGRVVGDTDWVEHNLDKLVAGIPWADAPAFALGGAIANNGHEAQAAIGIATMLRYVAASPRLYGPGMELIGDAIGSPVDFDGMSEMIVKIVNEALANLTGQRPSTE